MNAHMPWDVYAPSSEMALLPANRTSYATHRIPRNPARRGVFARITAFFDRQTAIREMAGLSDRELTDIGLSRSDLDQVFDADFNARHSR